MAARFWVGGTGDLDGSTTTHIAATSGGAGGASYPGAGDTLTFDGSSGGGTITFTAALTIAALTIGAFAGTVDTNGQTVVVTGTFDGNGTATRTLNLGSSSVTVGTWFFITPTNLTFNCGTSTLTISATFGTFYPGGLTYATVVFAGSSRTIAGSMTCATFTRTGTAAKTNSMTLGGNITVTGTLTINGNSDVNRMLILSGTKGTQYTITAAVVSVTNIDLQDIIGAGAGDWDLSAISGLSGDCGGNSGITFTPPTTNYWIGGTGNADAVAEWANSSGGSGGTGRVPLPQDSAVVDGNSGTGTITQNMPRTGSWDFAGSSGITWTTNTVASFFGSIDLTDLATLTGSTQTYTYEGRGASMLTSAGNAWAKTFNLDCVTGSLTQGDAFAGTVMTPRSGTWDDGGHSFLAAYMDGGAGTASATLVMSQVWELTSGTVNPWTARASLSITPGASTILLTGTLTAVRTFVGGGLTYYNLENATTGAFALQFTGSNIFNNFHIDASAAARTILFQAGTTTTVASMTRDAGTNVITIGSITAASHTLTKVGGGIISLDYLSVSRSTATPATTWYAGTTSTDGGNNSGWSFTAPAVSVSSPAIASLITVLGNSASVSGSALSGSVASASVSFGSVSGSSGGSISTAAGAILVCIPSPDGSVSGDATTVAAAAILDYLLQASEATGAALSDSVQAFATSLDAVGETSGSASTDAIQAIIHHYGRTGELSAESFIRAIAALQLSYSDVARILRDIALLRATSLSLSSDLIATSVAVIQDLTIAANPTVEPVP